MALDLEIPSPNTIQTIPLSITAISRRVDPTRRGVGVTLRTRRKTPTVRLGGKKPKRGFSLTRMLRKMRARWLRLKYVCMLKKLKGYYRDLMKEIAEAGATVEAYQQRVMSETSNFAVPGIGISFYPSYTAAGRNMPRPFVL